MNDGNIYQAPAGSGPAFVPQPLPVHKPAILQVFGILHLLAAGYGLVTGLWGVFMAVAGNPFINMVPPGPARDAQENMTRAIQPMMNINMAITAVLVVLVTIAGIKLLRAKKDAVKASNRMGDLPAGVKTGMDAAMIGGAIGGILFTCLYPILTLILLNRRSVKGWLEQFGK